MAAGLSPQDKEALLRALIAGGGTGLADPAAALQNLLQAQGGMSAAQSIIAGLRNRLLPAGAAGTAAGAGSPMGRASIAARGLSGEEPTYAQEDNESRRPSGILGGPKEGEKKSDITDTVKKLAEKTPGPPEPPSKAAGGILAMGPSQGPDPGTVRVPNIPDVPSSVNRSVARGRDADLTRAWMNFLMKPVAQGGLGRTLAQATGEVASLHGESAGLNPNLTHDPDKNGNPTGYGTAAWRDDPRPGGSKRWTGLKNFAAQNGLDWKTPEGQMAWYREEMLTTHRRANEAIAAAKTPAEATRAHVYLFEIPKYKEKEAVGRTKHFATIQAAMAGQREVGAGPDSMGRGATTGPGLDPSLKPPPAKGPVAPQPTGILSTPTDTGLPAFKDSGGRPIKGLVIHHTADDNGKVPETVDDLRAMYAKGNNGRGITGAHLFIDRQGGVHQTLDFGQAGQHTKPGDLPAGSGFGNRNTIGVEISAKDDSDILPVQREAMKKLWPQLQSQYKGIQPLAHGEIRSEKQPTEGATVIGDLRSLGQSLPKPGEDVPLPPRRPDDLTSSDQPLTVNVTPSRTETPAPDVSAPDPDFANITPAEQASLGGDDMGGLGDIGGLLGGLDTGDAAANEPSQLQEWDQEEAKEPDKPILSEEDKKPAGILSGDSGLLAGQDQGRVDLARVFSPEGFGGTGLLGRDQAPETTGFKAPVGLPQGGQTVGPMGVVPAAGGILSGAPGGIASITPPQLRSIAPAPAAPLPPPRPSNDALGILASPPALEPPAISSPGPSKLTTSALPPRPPGIGFDPPLPSRRPSDLGNLGTPPASAGILAPPAALSPLAVDPDRMLRDPFPSTPNTPGAPTGILGSPAQPPAPGILGRTFAQDAAKPTPSVSVPDMSRLMDALGGSSGLLAGSGSGSGLGASSRPIAPASSARRLLKEARRPMNPLLQGGILGSPNQGIDLNRYFGLLSGSAG